MTLRNASTATLGRFLAVVTGLIFLVGCGSSSGGGGSTPTPVANTVAVEVNSGPTSLSVNMAFADVTICMPGTTNCQTISNVELDTGSSGLRVLSSAVNLTLPTITDSSTNVLQECFQFADASYTWGPVAVADIQLAGETASSVPLQLINAPNTGFAVPSSCLSLGNGVSLNTVAALGGNGILGIGNFPQDCGGNCTSASAQLPSQYFLCPSGVCQVPAVPLADQVWNPVVLFAQDNNGVLLSLPSIPAGGQATVSGTLTFGIGTQTNNALGSAQVYATDAFGNIQTTYPTTNGVSYPGFLDTGSTGFYFLDATTLGPTGIIECSDAPGWYCPSSPVSFTVTNTGTNGTSGPLTFSIGNADTLFGTLANTAFNDLGGDSGTGISTDYADFGMPFFYGKNVFVGILGTTAPSGVSAPFGYYAY
ncbi:MAG: DUF3443 family protein [Terriglobia bacterium]|jgi:hypothetical protein